MLATKRKTRAEAQRYDARPAAQVYTFRQSEPEGPAKRLKDQFEAEGLFKFDSNTTGSDILVLRAFLRQQGLPEIPEKTGVHTFATLAGRFLLPRRLWPLYGPSDKVEARAFLKKWAAAILPHIGGDQKPPRRHRRTIPELAHLYNPEIFGVRVH